MSSSKGRVVAFLFVLLFASTVLFAGGQSQPASGAGAAGDVPRPANFPVRNISFILPTPAGSGTDLPARALIESLSLGRPMVIVNRPGGSQTVGAAEAASRPPDGYTILLSPPAGLLMQPHIIDVTYSLDSFRHISLLTAPEPMGLYVNSNSPIKTFDDLLIRIRRGDRLTYSFSNPGGLGHLAMLNVLAQIPGHNCEFVPFSGGGEVVAAGLGGHIDFFSMDPSGVTGPEEQGQIIALTVLSDQPYEFYPGLRPAGDYGFTGMGSYVAMRWLSIHKDTPDGIVQWLKQEFDRAIQSDHYKDFLQSQRFAPVRLYTEEELTRTVHALSEVFHRQLRDLGMARH